MGPKDMDSKINDFIYAATDKIIKELSEKGIDVKEHRQMIFENIKMSNIMSMLIPLFS